MSKRFQLSGKTMLAKLKKLGFVVIRIRGSHYRMKHEDGRLTTVPVNGNKDLPKGLYLKRLSFKLFDEGFCTYTSSKNISIAPL